MLCTVIRKVKCYCFWCYEILRIHCCLLMPFAFISLTLFILSFASLSVTRQEPNFFRLIFFLDLMNQTQALNNCYMKQQAAALSSSLSQKQHTPQN